MDKNTIPVDPNEELNPWNVIIGNSIKRILIDDAYFHIGLYITKKIVALGSH